jgi:AcrR family transcriptional regulator
VKRSKRQPTPGELALIADMRARRRTTKEIAAALQVGKSTLYRWLAELEQRQRRYEAECRQWEREMAAARQHLAELREADDPEPLARSLSDDEWLWVPEACWELHAGRPYSEADFTDEEDRDWQLRHAMTIVMTEILGPELYPPGHCLIPFCECEAAA